MEPFAIIQAGGGQLRVKPNQLIEIEGVRLKDASKEKEVVLEKVLAVQKEKEELKVGNPFVRGASVLCEFLQEVRGPKTISFKLRRRKNYRRKKGYRAELARLRVKEIQLQG